jgi:hypothetical protein
MVGQFRCAFKFGSLSAQKQFDPGSTPTVTPFTVVNSAIAPPPIGSARVVGALIRRM